MTFCKAFTNNIRIDIHKNKTVFSPCCEITQFKEYTDLDSYLNSEELADMKQSTTFPINCGSCKTQEDQGQVSLRKQFDERFLESNNITQIEIMPNNTCNLKCFMCNPKFSSALAQEYVSLGWIDNFKSLDISKSTIEVIDKLDSLESLNIVGGEFFLAKSNIEIMKTALSKNIQSFRAVTNCTVILDEHLELLKQFKSLNLQISLDGVGSSYEFMRYPAKWETVEQNIKKILSVIPKSKINFQSVIQPLNIQHVEQILNTTNVFAVPHRLKNLVTPTWLSWSILKDNERQIIIQHLKKIQTLPKNQLINVAKFINTIESINYSEIDRQQFITNMKQILKLRELDATIIDKHFGILIDLRNELH